MDSSNEKIQGTYSQIIKQLRGKAFLSQEKFASEIGFCPATLNRWEKGTKSPSFLSKQLLQSYCDKHNILSICNLVIKGLLKTQADGTTKLMTFLDEQRECRLYEKFILEYYRKHYPMLSVNPEQIAWQLDDSDKDMLPIMQSDIMLRKGNHVFIIDAKYYLHNTQEQYGAHTLHSANLYQIFTYVKNKEYELKDVEHIIQFQRIEH